MQRGLVGSEMCIRDRYQRRVHGMQNLEMKKEAHLSKKLKEEKEKEMAVIKEELDSIKEQLRLKDQQLQLSQTQIHKQSKELQNLKQVKQLHPQVGQRENTHSKDPETRMSNQNFKKLSFRKTKEKNESGTMKIEHQPFSEEKRTSMKSSTPYDSPRNPSLNSNPQCKEKNKIILGVTTKRIKPIKKEIQDKGECSFLSVSSVSMNINEISNSDIEVMDSCINALNKRKQNASSPYVFRRPQSKTTHAKMEPKLVAETNYEKFFGQPAPLTKKSDIALKSYTQKPTTALKKNVVDIGKIPIYPLVESIKFQKEGKQCLPTVEKKAPINNKNNCLKEIKVVLHSGGKDQLFKERSESVQEKIPLSNSGRKPEYKSETKGFFSNVSANYGSALNQLAGNSSAKSHLLEAFKPSILKNIERNPSIKMPRSLSLHESKSNVSQAKHRKKKKKKKKKKKLP
eukprot:TRINITY_DN7291_c0_g1_i2.p1 TRINITY_DN7291_c0_g1~~TRINITY_DN7291_c0_g1_i2.p1  ORF type:complete len:456 (-),score=109.49 TRINITY_DN7291_c0_g1_i2:189-1556(-)